MIRRLLFLLALGVGGAVILRTYVIEAISVASGSMEPTLFVGTSYLLNRAVYRFRAPQRGEIIDFISPLDPEKGMIKRVIAIPGDEVEIRAKKVILNGKPLEEPYTVHKRADERLVGDNLGPLKVPDHSLFVLGDNRDNSDDSSVWRDPKTNEPLYFVPMTNVRGKIIQVP